MPKDTGKKLADMLYGQPFDVPTPENLRLGQQLIEQELREKAARDAKLTPLDKAKAAYEAAKMMGSAAVAGLGSIPTRIVYGPEAAEKYIANRISIPETEKGMDYVQNVGDFLEQLETKYKLPPIMPEAMALQHLTGPATKQATRAAKQKVMQAGKAGERYAERKVPQIMERGGAGADVLSGLARNTQSPLTVWHGSPHKFPPTAKNPLGEFDPTKIGTGEGAQAYGHGHYTAQAKNVGEEYAKNLANRDIKNQGRLNAHANAQRLAGLAGDPKYAADDIRFVLLNEPDHPQKDLLQDTLAFLESGDFARPLETKGHIYKIDLPDEAIAKMLDWDKPFKQHSEEIKEAVVNLANSLDENSSFAKAAQSGESGKNLWQAMVDEKAKEARNRVRNGELIENTNKWAQEAAADIFREYGIPGIKYLDQSSRQNVPSVRSVTVDGKTKYEVNPGWNAPNQLKFFDTAEEAQKHADSFGTSNFVVFPGGEDLLTILERKKEGGRVHISDNPDVMQLELAGGGLVKGLIKTGKNILLHKQRDLDDAGYFVIAKDASRKDATGQPLSIGRLHVPDEAVKNEGWKIGDIYVNQDYRRQGIASQMIDEMSKELGANPVGATSVFSPEGEALFKSIGQKKAAGGAVSYAEGGEIAADDLISKNEQPVQNPVHFTKNPDAMRLAMMQRN